MPLWKWQEVQKVPRQRVITQGRSLGNKMKIILGSQSKGRKLMLEEMGIEFNIVPANIDEKAIRLDNPKDLVLVIARAKAEALKERISEPAILITSDQVVVWNGQIREKPENEKEAREFLRGYNTYPAETVTSVIVTNLQTGKTREKVDVAKIYFNNSFTEEDIDAFIKDGSLFNYAGGFTIQGDKWVSHIKEIQGTRDSVIGLPKEITKNLIEQVA